ncbi:unnamed protein product [Triticum turgidum subsp. durum]|uniref:Subtilisin-like protease n=1 Tax=Triticum turgidum subsp. durum TaxID=4567 RepID=A0A9R0R164_TRITD|nr:unnamed protein product [Triticum turgidum subsp. durum]
MLKPTEEGQDADADAARAWHRSFLPSATTAQGKPRLLYSYRTVFTGFAARLTEEELKVVSAKPGFIRSFDDNIYRAQTTHTTAFLGLPNRMGESPDKWPGNGGQGVIIGVIDHGIDDTHPSLEDAGFMDMPSPLWKGSCHPNMKCNKKLIGVKNMYVPDDVFITLARDTENGHGTHVATTAAGNFVANVSVNGLANGTASGVAPYAHLAIYKVCSESGDCPEAAVLRAMDEAVADGVHVISVSLAARNIPTYDRSSIGIGGFNAMQQGVHVVVCAGNYGPAGSSVRNAEPWLLTVGAGTVDRYFPATVYLEGPADDTHAFAVGESLADRMKLLMLPSPTFHPLLYRTEDHRGYCAYPYELIALVSGHVVICDLADSIGRDITIKLARTLLRLHASAVVFVEPEKVGYTIDLYDFGPLSQVIQVTHKQGEILKKFASGGPVRYALVNWDVGTQDSSPAPTVADFSGRGLSKWSPGVLKPDLLAPGLNILAGVPARPEAFAFKSGTSMATPHVSGLVALLKRVHPTWSPAIMRSALMTTASTRDNSGGRIMDEQRDPDPAALYATGAGHVDLARAMDPGLAYDIDTAQYIGYLCSNFGEMAMRAVTRNSSGLCSDHEGVPQEQLNYPSIVVTLFQQQQLVVRTLTNLQAEGLPEVYKVAVAMPGLVLVNVEPAELIFTAQGHKQSYSIRVTLMPKVTFVKGAVFEGSITWSSSRHVLRSPMVAVVDL